ncbi:radical S-adenosyl methionine domain-containing protein 1, mitochondrial isoform X3 [Prionailurus viverrinus]|uniref:radical S-adenosyl methionine domain-containing protein 1, mitochondrial isoform X3 n=1 Tax=Prionailurus viverrinus TaxID=61388 RepID=UPI001FF46090|nr:radical S-adenosyl methionine domain-containing protein 1, mitochondrial isoform X3 [Prionailurus viverrinus]
MGRGTRPRTGDQKAGKAAQPTTLSGKGLAGAVSASGPSRWRRRGEARGPPSPSGDAARGHAVPLPPAGAARAARLARLCALPCVPGACLPISPRTRPLPAVAGAMALPGARARGWAAATKMAQRRRHAEGAKGSPSPAPPSSRAALYVHWPYCEKRCSYCNFNKVDSVFFGGGTPSLASPNTVAAVLEAVDQSAHLPADSEVTLEANPTSAPGSRLAAFGAAGINRLSIGLQSLDDKELQLLGRTHSASDALQTLAEARRLFPRRVSVDLMLGLPAQKSGPWLRQLQELLGYCDDHISLYQLTLERGTALFTQVQRGTLPAPDPEVAAEMYQEGRTVLREAGFRQYEVSNFARNGALSTHNWTYWQCGQYLGVGPGAHGRFVPQGAGGHTREARIQTLEPDNWMKEARGSFGHGATYGRGDHSPALAAVCIPAEPMGRVWIKPGGEGLAGTGPVAAGSQGSSVFLGGSGCTRLSVADPPAPTPRGLAAESPLPWARGMTRCFCDPRTVPGCLYSLERGRIHNVIKDIFNL